MAVVKAGPAAAKADLAGVVQRADLAAVEKARGMAAAGRVGHRGKSLAAVVVTRLPNSLRFLQFASYQSLRATFAVFLPSAECHRAEQRSLLSVASARSGCA